MPVAYCNLKTFRKILIVVGMLFATSLNAQEIDEAKHEAPYKTIRFFHIGTGSTCETSFQVGGLIASTISKPPGSRDCDKGGNCGVSDMISVAQSTRGAAMNAANIGDGKMKAALIHADIAYMANYGKGLFKDSSAVGKLRAVAMLHTESIHLVTKKESNIKSIKDLKEKRVSFGARGSGTLESSRVVLEAFELAMDSIEASHMETGQAIDALISGEIDAFFMIAAAPSVPLVRLAENFAIKFIPISGSEVKKINSPFLSKTVIGKNVYKGFDEIPTLKVGVLFVLSSDVPEQLSYNITRAIWHKNNQKVFKNYLAGNFICIKEAVKGLGIPLHAGAKKYYKEAGVIP
ncbi:MAG: TAXI family TRAP transporter solute-binding subunit [Alphaproteobacteria bacterium]|nr:TAXI family TRAP transporter solute-binding subunit [Alphaproteobacteria bacterium]